MSLVAEVVFSGFVSKAVNNCVDISWDKIKKAAKDKNNKHQSLESQIYNVTVDVLNKLTDNQYKDNQSIIYDATESLLKLFRESSIVDLENIISCLKNHFSYVDKNKCMDFKVLLYEELGKNEYSELFHTILLFLLEQKNQYDREVMEQLNQKLDQVILILNQKNDDDKGNNISSTQQKVKSRTQEYADKWNANMFLNDFDKRDENAGVNVKLSEVYLEEHLPHYIWGRNEKPLYDLKTLLYDYIDIKNDKKMLLIFGQPGIGKSTLITWITANFTSRVENILVYQFASDLKDIDWGNQNVADEILKKLGLINNDLNGKTLILDGFDEVNVGGDRKKILDNIYWYLIRIIDINKFSLIITCRENYIQDFEKVKCKYITLSPWDDEQIKSFCTIFQERTKCDISEHTLTRVIENKDIFGIPIILYMILALNITIEKEGSVVDIYDKIFSLEGGIYDRCIENKNFADNHRIVGEIKKQIHQISKEIAIWMFENNPSETYIPRKEYLKICDNVLNKQEQKNEDVKQDILIGNFFRLRHFEGVGTEELLFVHRSIYEYFVAETIYSSIKNAMITLSEESQEILIQNITYYLKTGQIDSIIGEFLKYKIIKLYYNMNYDKRRKYWKWWENAIEKMMKRGMLYHIKSNMKRFDYVVIHEAICFRNVMHISSLISEIYPCEKFMLSTIEEGLLQIYIQLFSNVCFYSSLHGVEGKILYSLNIQNTVFLGGKYDGLYLAGCNFHGSNFTNQNLSRSIITGANLSDVIMVNANLSKVNFNGTNLEKADLRGADLGGADLDFANIKGINLEGAYIEDSIWMEESIPEMLPQLQKAVFEHIIIQHISGQERVHRDKLFSL